MEHSRFSPAVLMAPTLLLTFLTVCLGLSFLINPTHPLTFFSTEGAIETITYTMYGVALIIAITFWRDFINTQKQTSYILFLVLWLAALLREMGIQHALTSTDTTAIKIRFFTNPNNPLSEKIITAILVLAVVGIILKLLIEYTPKIIRGFFNFNPIYWTVCTFGGIGIISKIADRFPGNYYKSTGARLTETMELWFKLVEEAGEACLPLLFALALYQYHNVLKKQN